MVGITIISISTVVNIKLCKFCKVPDKVPATQCSFSSFLPAREQTKVPIVTLFLWVGGRERKVSVGRVAVLWCPSQVPLPPFMPLLRTLISEGLHGAQSSADGTPAPLQSLGLAGPWH